MRKKFIPFALIVCLTAGTITLGSCNKAQEETILRIASWDEYIDEGGEDS